MPKPGFYAVAIGRQPGIYTTWPETLQQVSGYKHAVHKKFSTRIQAEQFIQQHRQQCNSVDNSSTQHNNGSNDSNALNTGVSSHTIPSQTNAHTVKSAPITHHIATHDNGTVVSIKSEPNTTHNNSNTTVLLHRASIEQICQIIGSHTLLNTNLPTYKAAILYTDGAARNNPSGHAGAGVVLYTDNNSVICKCSEYLGIRSNNESEYIALLLGIELACAYSVQNITIHCDSELIVKQITGVYKTHSGTMQRLHSKVIQLKQRFTTFRIQHVLRHKNTVADELSNIAIDERRTDCSNYYMSNTYNNNNTAIQHINHKRKHNNDSSTENSTIKHYKHDQYTMPPLESA